MSSWLLPGDDGVLVGGLVCRREKWLGVEDELLARGREGWGCRWRSRGVSGWGIWTEGAIPRGKRESGGGKEEKMGHLS